MTENFEGRFNPRKGEVPDEGKAERDRQASDRNLYPQPPSLRTAEETAFFLLSHLKPGMRALDAGCGPGTITVGLSRYVAPGKVVGIDQCSEVIDQVRAYALEKGATKVRFEVSGVYELPFADGSFDLVYAHQLLQHLGDPVAALGEMSRVLSAGGIIALRDADYGTMILERAVDRFEKVLTI